MSPVVPLVEAPGRRRGLGDGVLLPPPGGDGGRGPDPSPPGALLDNAVLATMFLIAGEIMFFAALVSAFWVLRLAAPAWPPPLQPRLPVGVTGLNTIVLLASSAAMGAALRALGRGDRRATVQRLGAAAGLGILFLVVQGSEWARLVHFGLTMSSSSYGTAFYTLIGTHAAHVLGALVWLAVTLLAVARGRLTAGRPARLRACALFWHFVVALWPILYVSVYLL
ncbi:MAG: heme-copper oxidase subunit III [Candidatus Rokubacteria bacterium]|nr:heme-copper oxidase subunit III [Candidatus Rokubacteria bacterium]MBI4593349.1 heme-copper oxidase subunit III [Candidatus Rokubacteria bacterium]